MNTRKVQVDGLSVETTDTGAEALEKLLRDREERDTRISTLQRDHTAAIGAKDAVIATKDAEIAELKAKQLTPAQLDAAAAARGDLIATARRILGKDEAFAGKSDSEIRRAVVVAKVGDAEVKDKSTEYVDAYFAVLAKQTPTGDAMREALLSQSNAPAQISDARKSYHSQLTNGWQGNHNDGKGAK